MRTFRFLGMALIATLVCVNFAACSSDSIENEEEIIANQKKLVEMKGMEYGDFTFSYDEKGRLITSIYGDKSTYAWGIGAIIQTENNYVSTYILNEENFIVKIQGSGYVPEYTYNFHNQLVRVEDRGYTERTCSWEGENLEIVMRDFTKDENNQEVADEIYTIEYSGKTCKGYNPMLVQQVFKEEQLMTAHPELYGLRSNQLINKVNMERKYFEYVYEEETDSWKYVREYSIIDVAEHSYTFDDDGYIESCTVKTTEEDGNTEIEIYTFKWE